MTLSHPTAGTYPYFVRLAVDLDPAGNPIGCSLAEHRDGQTEAPIIFFAPEPFCDVREAFSDLLTEYVDCIGVQLPLF